MSRTKTKHFVPYPTAVQLVRDSGVTNRAQYRKWHKESKPYYLPKHPEVFYSEWESWNAFLGNTNSFEKTLDRVKGSKRVYRGYWDAVRYAQGLAKELNLKVKDDWERLWDEYDMPDDIPRRPYQVYEGFSWIVWLGISVKAKLETSANSVAIMGLHSIEDAPGNVCVMKVWRGGYYVMKESIDDKRIGSPLKLYVIESNDDIHAMDAIINTYGSKQGDGSVIVANMYEMVYEMDNALLMYKHGT